MNVTVGMGYLLLCNLLGFCLMGVDKFRAKRHLWRIRERTLFLCSLLGGSLGTWAGMYVFHHKTRHWYFVIGMPTILIAQVVAAYLLVGKYGLYHL